MLVRSVSLVAAATGKTIGNSAKTISSQSAPGNQAQAPSQLSLQAPPQDQSGSEPAEFGDVSGKEEEGFFRQIVALAKKGAGSFWEFINEHKAIAVAITALSGIFIIFSRNPKRAEQLKTA